MFVTPKFCISIVFSFSWGLFNSQEKLKTMLMQNFGVTSKEYYGMLWYFLEWSIENVSLVCKVWYKPERGWENSRQLCKPEMKWRVCTWFVENSPNPSRSSIYIRRRLCKYTKKAFYCLYKLTSSRKNAKTFGTG